MSESRHPLQTLLDQYAVVEGGLLPCLHAIQNAQGYIHPDDVAHLAQAFNLSRAEVHGTISFYHYFKTTPPTSLELQLCRAESCQAMGSRALEEAVIQGIQADAVLREQVSIAPVYCLGNCACSPCARIDQDVYGEIETNQLLDVMRQKLGVSHA